MNENVTGLVEAIQTFTLTPGLIAGLIVVAILILMAVLLVRYALTGGR